MAHKGERGKKKGDEDESMPSECEDDDANNDEVNEPDNTEISLIPILRRMMWR